MPKSIEEQLNLTTVLGLMLRQMAQDRLGRQLNRIIACPTHKHRLKHVGHYRLKHGVHLLAGNLT